jgi:hypothetical protein
MTESDVWAPLLALLKEQGYALPKELTLIVEGHTVTVDVPDEMVGSSGS